MISGEPNGADGDWARQRLDARAADALVAEAAPDLEATAQQLEAFAAAVPVLDHPDAKRAFTISMFSFSCFVVFEIPIRVNAPSLFFHDLVRHRPIASRIISRRQCTVVEQCRAQRRSARARCRRAARAPARPRRHKLCGGA